MLGFDINQLLLAADKFRNTDISGHLSRVQGIEAPRERVSYFGSLGGFAFFGRRGRFVGLPDSTAVAAVEGLRDLAGADLLWRQLVGT